MAVSSWFSNWNPPHNLVSDQQNFPSAPFHMRNINDSIYVQRNNHGYRNGQVQNWVPFLMQLGMLDFRTESPETTGPFRTWYHWNVLDFAFPTLQDRDEALRNEEFIPENNLPLGVEVYKNRIFVSMPKWKPGVPATLAALPRVPTEVSPPLSPYPNWHFHTIGYCRGLTSVFRMQADTCGRLWVLDSGQIDVTIKPKQVCPPQVFIFDLETDQLLLRYTMPDDFVKEDSLYSNIAVDIRDGECDNAHAYLTDVWRFGLVVFSLKRHTSWRITDHLFYPEPLAAAYTLHDLHFEWTDGIFGLALSPVNFKSGERLLYFHPMSSFREFYVKTSVIWNETGWSEVEDAFNVMGQSRGKAGQVSASAIDRNGIMFYNLVTRDSVGCWDSRKPYKRDNLGVVARSDETLVFPNDLKVDNEQRQSVWVLSNRLPFYLYKGLDRDSINFRIMSAFTDDAVKGTICDPGVRHLDSFRTELDEVDCY